jgi:hypothetical protein
MTQKRASIEALALSVRDWYRYGYSLPEAEG